MSPKQMTRLAMIIAGLSTIGLPVMLILRPAWGLMVWWPLAGFALAALLIVTAFLYGAYLTAQKRVDMVDMLNDCYQGNDPKKHTA